MDGSVASWAGLGTLVGLFGLIYRTTKTRIDQVDRDKVDKSLCRERHENIVGCMNRNGKQMGTILETQAKMLKTLTRIDERVNFLMRGALTSDEED